MRATPVNPVGPVRPELVARVAYELGHRRTLADVLAWARALSPARQVSEIVTQDEYTHDVVLPFEGGHCLVFDAT